MTVTYDVLGERLTPGLCLGDYVLLVVCYMWVFGTRGVYVIGYTLWTTSYGRVHVIYYSSRVMVHGLWSRVLVSGYGLGLWSRVMVSGYSSRLMVTGYGLGLWSRVIVHGLWSRVMVSGYGIGL